MPCYKFVFWGPREALLLSLKWPWTFPGQLWLGETPDVPVSGLCLFRVDPGPCAGRRGLRVCPLHQTGVSACQDVSQRHSRPGLVTLSTLLGPFLNCLWPFFLSLPTSLFYLQPQGIPPSFITLPVEVEEASRSGDWAQPPSEGNSLMCWTSSLGFWDLSSLATLGMRETLCSSLGKGRSSWPRTLRSPGSLSSSVSRAQREWGLRCWLFTCLASEWMLFWALIVSSACGLPPFHFCLKFCVYNYLHVYLCITCAWCSQTRGWY